jgi:hypothetical protein
MPDLIRILLVLAAMTSFTVQAIGTASIEGRITNSVTGEAIGNVKVRFLDRHNYVYSVVTDSSGSYRITGLDEGDYRGEFTRDGFSESTSNPFSRVAGIAPARIDAQLKPWAALRGHVVDEDGTPAAGVQVEIEADRVLRVDDNLTDANGEFAFPGLLPGSYALVAKPPPKIRVKEGVRLGMVASYYPSVTDLGQAVRIPVRTGQEVSGLEIKLRSVPVHRVAGVVLNEAGKPAPHATVKLLAHAGGTRRELTLGFIMPPAGVNAKAIIDGPGFERLTITGPGAETELARVQSNDDGTFEFPAVEAGDWRLSANGGADDEMPRGGVASAVVSERDIEDVQIRLADSFATEVTTSWGSEQSPLATRVTTFSLGLMPVEGQPRIGIRPPNVEGLSQQAMREVIDAAAARVANRVFPGRYRVLPGGGAGGFHVVAVMWGGRDVNGQVVELAPGAGPFQMILSSAFGGVQGKVENGDGATVFLVSGERGEIVDYRQMQCRPGGSFEFGNVPPGDYYVVAFDWMEGGGLPATDLPGVIAPLASSVRVEAGAKASVELKIQKSPW